MCQISRLLLWKWPQECLNVAIEFCFIMRIFYELRYTVIIEIVWTFYLTNVPAKFQKYSKHISWVISRTSSSKLSCIPRHPSRNISCNHRHHLLQPSSRWIFSTSNNQKTRADSDINSDYQAIPLTNYISGAENETQRASLGHTNGNIEMCSPSAAAMLTMVAAATIVRFPPVYLFTDWPVNLFIWSALIAGRPYMVLPLERTGSTANRYGYTRRLGLSQRKSICV